jgi:phospholipid/cholesterol/gamma-HCH transport system permease protein
MKYLTVPRVLAATLSLPALIAVGDAIGIFGGYAVSTSRLGFSETAYLRTTAEVLESWDVASGLVKGAVFGFIVAIMGCYHGMYSGRGARGVGRATTDAVVSASIAILAANYLLTELFFNA